MEKRVYLAGSVIGLSYKEFTGWREYAKLELAKYGIIGVSSMRFKEHLKDKGVIFDSDNSILECDKGITVRARLDVKNSDLFLANLLGAKEVSKGTLIEYGWADAFGKPIVSVIEREGNVHEHPLVRELTGFRVENLDEGLEVVRKILSY